MSSVSSSPPMRRGQSAEGLESPRAVTQRISKLSPGRVPKLSIDGLSSSDSSSLSPSSSERSAFTFTPRSPSTPRKLAGLLSRRSSPHVERLANGTPTIENFPLEERKKEFEDKVIKRCIEKRCFYPISSSCLQNKIEKILQEELIKYYFMICNNKRLDQLIVNELVQKITEKVINPAFLLKEFYSRMVSLRENFVEALQGKKTHWLDVVLKEINKLVEATGADQEYSSTDLADDRALGEFTRLLQELGNEPHDPRVRKMVLKCINPDLGEAEKAIENLNVWLSPLAQTEIKKQVLSICFEWQHPARFCKKLKHRVFPLKHDDSFDLSKDDETHQIARRLVGEGSFLPQKIVVNHEKFSPPKEITGTTRERKLTILSKLFHFIYSRGLNSDVTESQAATEAECYLDDPKEFHREYKTLHDLLRIMTFPGISFTAIKVMNLFPCLKHGKVFAEANKSIRGSYALTISNGDYSVFRSNSQLLKEKEGIDPYGNPIASGESLGSFVFVSRIDVKNAGEEPGIKESLAIAKLKVSETCQPLLVHEAHQAFALYVSRISEPESQRNAANEWLKNFKSSESLP